VPAHADELEHQDPGLKATQSNGRRPALRRKRSRGLLEDLRSHSLFR